MTPTPKTRARPGRGLLALILLLPFIAGCSNMNIEDFKNATPKLDLAEYFKGRTLAHGLFEDRFGTVRRQFTVDIVGEMEGDTLVLTEDFQYADGETDQRIWRITRTGESTYEGRAGDIIGVAQGRVAGNALNWRYDMDLPVGESTWRVHFNDWMFLQPGGVMLNRAKVSKWGFEIGSVTLAFHKPAEG